MLRCPKCSAPNPDGRVDCYACQAPLDQTQVLPAPTTAFPAPPPAAAFPPPPQHWHGGLFSMVAALSQWLNVLGWIVLGLTAFWVIYWAAEFGPMVGVSGGWLFFMFLVTLVFMGLAFCVLLRAFGAVMTLLSNMHHLLSAIESNTRQNPNP